jgi:hypothetical protein
LGTEFSGPSAAIRFVLSRENKYYLWGGANPFKLQESIDL